MRSIGSTARASPKRNVVMATLGGLVEWFDFTIYGFLAVPISKVFFPSIGPSMALLASLATFGAGFGARPVGALIFGRLGDLRGRKFVLIASISIMALASFLIAAAPGYASWGLGGAAVLVAGRLLQGVSAGAEFGSSVAYLIELAPPGRRGVVGSLHQVGAAGGVLLGALTTAALTSLLGQDTIVAWGWRLPFLIGGGLALVGLILRLGLKESPAFERVRDHRLEAPPRLRPPIVPVLQNIGIGALWTVAVFAAVVYMPIFAVQFGGIPPARALWASVLALAGMLCVIPAAGHAADRFGVKPVILAASLGYLVCVYPGFVLVARGGSYGITVMVMVVFALLAGVISGVGPLAIGQLFEVERRSTWTSIGSALGIAVFGGFAPFFATLLIQLTKWPPAPCLYVTFAALLTGITALTLPNRRTFTALSEA